MRKKIDDLDLMASAYLFGNGAKQQEIAKVLNLSQATVSRLIKQARNKYLEYEPRFREEEVDAETKAKILHRISRTALGDKLDAISEKHAGRRGPVLRVFPSGSKDTTPKGWDARLATFGQNAAPFVKELLLRAELCGVSWGGTIGNVVTALKKLPGPPGWAGDGRRARVIPLCGEPLGNEPTVFSSSNLAADLENLLNGSNKESLSLGMVPAFIPEGFTRTELKGVWRLIELVKAYTDIIGRHGEISGRPAERGGRGDEQAPMVERLDMVLTSVGPSERLLGYGSGELLLSGDFDMKELKKLVLGDISGVLVERPGLSEAGQAKLRDVNARWTGVRLPHLKGCAERSARSNPVKGKPGVVVVAIGENKAQFVYEAVKLGLVNHLLVDEDLEERLEKIVGSAAA